MWLERVCQQLDRPYPPCYTSSMPKPQNAPDPHLETDIWRWLLFESGLSRRQAKSIILQNAQSSALSLFWQAGPETFVRQLGLDGEEATRVGTAMNRWATLQARWQVERSAGLHSLRINEPGYPATLNRHLPAEQRPLLLFFRGEPGLLDLPFILPLADTTVREEVATWALETLAELTAEGALALFIAQPGLNARLVKAFLAAELPFALVIPQGLAAYEPPASLKQALTSERVLLISPFQPEWHPPETDDNPFLPHAQTFARALAHALLTLTSLQTPPHPQQPCFQPPTTAAIEHAEPYLGPETLFLRLAEISMAPSLPQSSPVSPRPEPDLEPISPEAILETLSLGGHIPPALAARIRGKKGQA